MALSLRSSSQNSAETGTAITVAEPTGAAVGDLIVVHVHANQQTTIVDNNHQSVSFSNLTSGQATSVSSKVTASISWNAGDLLLLSVAHKTEVSTNPTTATASTTGLTWNAIDNQLYDSTGSSRRKITGLYALAASSGSGTVTISFGGQTQSHLLWAIDKAYSSNATLSIVQSAKNVDESASTSTLTVNLGAFASTSNATYGMFANYGITAGSGTPGTGFTEIIDLNETSNNLHLSTEYKTSNDTSVDYNFTENSQMGGIAIEIAATSLYTENINDYKPNTSGGHTVSVFSRVKQTGDPSTLSFTSGASDRWSAIAMCWADHDGFDVNPSTSNAANTDDSASGDITAPTITTNSDGAIHVVAGFWDTAADGTITEPSGYTNIQEIPGGEPQAASYKSIASAGATGSQTYSNTENAPRIAFSYAIKPLGGTNYTRSQVDSEGITDSITRTVTTVRSKVDSMGITDTRNRTVSSIRSKVDSVGLSDTNSRVVSGSRSLQDSQGMTDNLQGVMSAIRGISESLGITDVLDYQRILVQSLIDTLGITDSNARSIDYVRASQDSLGITEFISSISTISRAIVDSEGLTDSLVGSIIIVAQLIDDMGVTDTISRVMTYTRSENDDLGLSDTLTLSAQFVATLADVIGLEDLLAGTQLIDARLVDSMSLADILDYSNTAGATDYTRDLVDSLGITDAIGVFLTFRKQSIVKLESVDDIRGHLEGVKNK